MNNKVLVYGAIGIGVVVVLLVMRGSSNSGGNSVAAISTVPAMSGAVAANNAAAYEYMSASAVSRAETNAYTIAAGQMGLSDTLKEVSYNIASQVSSLAAASSIRNSTVAAVRESQFAADTAIAYVNSSYLLGMKELENDRAMIDLTLPLAHIERDKYIHSIDRLTDTEVNLATINANRDVELAHTAADVEKVVNSTWANAAIQQAYYNYRATKAAVQGKTGGAAWGNLLLGKSAAVGFGPISAAIGGSGSDQGGTTQASVPSMTGSSGGFGGWMNAFGSLLG